MAKSNKFNLKQAEQKARKALEAAIVDVGNTAKVFFVESFRKQGFDDKSVQKWKPRKRTTYKTKSGKVVDDTTRAILVKEGDLRRSIIRNPANRAALSIKISTNLDYAKIHNDGLMGKAFGKHPFKMPKRQFMGDSYNLNEKVKAVIVKRLDKVFL
jgi:phage gpG-like protein